MNWHSITRRLFLFLTGGMLAKLGLGHAAAVEGANLALSADEILGRMAKTYANCKTYQDSGCVTTIFIEADRQRTVKKPFSTAFVRPARFRFEFKSSFDEHTWRRYIVWAEGAKVRTWWDTQPGIKEQPSLSLGLAGATGVSGGSAHRVPFLLMPDKVLGRCPTNLIHLKRLADASFTGVDCIRIQGEMLIDVNPAAQESHRQRIMKVTGKDPGTPQYGPQMLWIDKSTFLLRRIDQQTRFENFSTESTTTYEPFLDTAIADTQLRFEPPDHSV